MRRFRILVSILLLASAQLLNAQDEADDAQPEFRYERWQDYRVGVGDVLDIQVVDIPDLSQVVDVSAAGEISFHPIGKIEIEGLSAAEVESRIAELLKEQELVREPQVLVFVQEFKAKRIYVSGEVAFPGDFVISQTMTVLDGILLAGGLSPLAGKYGYLHRRTSEGGAAVPPTSVLMDHPEEAGEGREVYRIDLEPLSEGRVPVPEMTLESGDFLIVPRRTLHFYFVLGEVIQPLNYVYPREGSLWVSQAIASAGGPTTTAKLSEGMLIRYDDAENRQEIAVDFKAILEGREPDVLVQPNDIIFIPGSIIKSIGEGYVRAANAMIAGTAFRVGRHYQLPDRPDAENID